ncbi:hypothetical protein [Burkholderia guangdongensis]|uniref:hypothetical protein n=1 Tax=Burkholderia guangdongensis TaxID=1792500 RepID=UPI0015CEA902|nr:hypothetical protein [Burkholderia guangdongensis]
MTRSSFSRALVGQVHDQKYLDRQRELSNAMDVDDLDDKPTNHGSYQFSSKLRSINKRFYDGENSGTLAAYAQMHKDSTRATPTRPKDLAALRLSKFESSTGMHEWITTDTIGDVIKSRSQRWMFYFNVMRCPTWLPILNPEKYHVNYQAYVKKIEEAASYAEAGPTCTSYILASELGLNGHSGGLSMDRPGESAKPLTVFQSSWHDEQREIFNKHCASNNYDGWAADLNKFLMETFLFAGSADGLPGLPNTGVSAQEVMGRIKWDLNLSDRDEKNPMELEPSPYGMDKIAHFLHREWNQHFQLLDNNYNAGKYY